MASPDPTPLSSASAGSSSRQFAGWRPDCARALHARAPLWKSGNATDALARYRGAGCRRIHASVITPRMPSDPSASRSGFGPAPEEGYRRDLHVLAGVIMLMD